MRITVGRVWVSLRGNTLVSIGGVCYNYLEDNSLRIVISLEPTSGSIIEAKKCTSDVLSCENQNGLPDSMPYT